MPDHVDAFTVIAADLQELDAAYRPVPLAQLSEADRTAMLASIDRWVVGLLLMAGGVVNAKKLAGAVAQRVNCELADVVAVLEILEVEGTLKTISTGRVALRHG